MTLHTNETGSSILQGMGPDTIVLLGNFHGGIVNLKKTAIILNGFIHDFAAGYWLAAIVAIVVLHRSHLAHPEVVLTLNGLERLFFWQSVAAMVFILATGAGRTFTYVDNYYGPDAERIRRRMLIIKHLILLAVFSVGYWFACGMTFH